MATKQEWREYFVLVNDREPSLEEFQAAQANGEIEQSQSPFGTNESSFKTVPTPKIQPEHTSSYQNQRVTSSYSFAQAQNLNRTLQRIRNFEVTKLLFVATGLLILYVILVNALGTGDFSNLASAIGVISAVLTVTAGFSIYDTARKLEKEKRLEPVSNGFNKSTLFLILAAIGIVISLYFAFKDSGSAYGSDSQMHDAGSLFAPNNYNTMDGYGAADTALNTALQNLRNQNIVGVLFGSAITLATAFWIDWEVKKIKR